MDADFSVELTPDAPYLLFPWADDASGLRYYDLRANPELVQHVAEAVENREVRDFLVSVNSQASILESAKCDVWSDDTLSEAEEIYDARLKFVSYVDILFGAEFDSGSKARFDFKAHEAFAKRVVELLSKVPQISASIELIIRRCYFHLCAEEPEAGFYWTVYVLGFGDEENSARRIWAIALDLVKNALLQVSAEFRIARPPE